MKPGEGTALYAEQVRQLYEVSRIGLISSFLNAPLLTFILWGVSSHRALIAWLSCLVVITVLRYGLVYAYYQADVSPDRARRWEMLFAAGSFFAGIAWGISANILFPAASLAHQMFLAFMLGGMVAGAASVYSISKSTFFLFSLPTVLPLTARFAAEGDDIHIAMGGLLVVFVSLMTVSALRVHKTMVSTLRLRFENKNLVEYLAGATADAESLNKSLTAEITEREKTEAALKRQQENLEHIVAERTAEIHATNRQLLQEIEEHRRSEQELRQARDFLEHVFRASADGLLVTDAGGYIIRANNSAAGFFGYDAQELSGMHMSALSPNVSETSGSPPWIQDLLRDGFLKNHEYEYKRKDGTLFTAQVNIVCMQDDRGAVVGATASIRDISEQKQGEKEKQKLLAQLHQAQKMEAIGTLAGGVAHDLNNILSAMVGYPDLLLLKLPEDNPLRKPLLTIKTAGEKAAAIVSDLLTLARRSVSAADVVNLNTVITDYLYSREYERLRHCHAGVVVEQQLAPDLLNIIGSPVHLQKTVMNLISNAAEAVAGGGRVIIATENRYLEEPVRGYKDVSRGEYSVLKVQDNGPGINEENLLRIFEPFYTKKVMGRSGTGLGLSVVWGTVEDHSGYIDVETVAGQGTTFTLYFPATRQEVQDKTVIPLSSYTGKGETILVVDDVESQREIASGILTTLGYTVATAASGEEALAYLKTQHADLMVLDMIMEPGIDGLETYRRIRQIRPGQKAVIASGYSETDRVQEVMHLGAGAYIKKPYTIEKIGLAVKNELTRVP